MGGSRGRPSRVCSLVRFVMLTTSVTRKYAMTSHIFYLIAFSYSATRRNRPGVDDSGYRWRARVASSPFRESVASEAVNAIDSRARTATRATYLFRDESARARTATVQSEIQRHRDAAHPAVSCRASRRVASSLTTSSTLSFSFPAIRTFLVCLSLDDSQIPLPR